MKRLKRRAGTKFSFTLSEAAKVAITVERKTTGRRVRGRCRKQTRSNRKARRCTLYVRAGVLRADKGTGRGSISFSGRFKSGNLDGVAGERRGQRVPARSSLVHQPQLGREPHTAPTNHPRKRHLGAVHDAEDASH